MWNREYRDGLEQRRRISSDGGGRDRVEKQHAAGKLTARERIDILLDKDSFVEVDQLIESRSFDFDMEKKRIPGDGVVTGYGKINGRLAFVSSEDFTVIGGTLGEFHSLKICRIMDMALKMKAPYISINDSGGARIEEGICSLSGYSGIFLRNTKASGVIPQISAIMGPCAGGACYSPAITDFVFMTEKTSQMFITGPQVVKAVMGVEITGTELGGSRVHSEKSGNAHFVYKDDRECLKAVRRLLDYLPQHNMGETQTWGSAAPDEQYADLESIVPDTQKCAYDVHQVIYGLIDKNSFLEVQKDFAKNIVIGLARIDGTVTGIIANQPCMLAGSLDCNASDKAARFVRFCDCFNIQILSIVDVPGYLPGSEQEHLGIIRHGAKLLYAYSEATVPKVSLILRKAFGGAYIAMNSKHMGADIVYAWPISQIAVMGAEGAVPILYRKQLEKSDKPDEDRKHMIADYIEHFMNPYLAASRGYVDEVILPEESRSRIVQAFGMLSLKDSKLPWKKHGNIPL